MDIIIAGCQGGIGRFLAESLAVSYRIHGTYHISEPEGSVPFQCHQLDVRSLHWCMDYAEKIKGDLGERIVLINAFGLSVDRMAHKMSSETWRSVVSTNLCGVFNMCRAFLPIMRYNMWGRIITLSSVVGRIGVPGTVAYAASKSGLTGLTRTLAAENARMWVTVNELVLGYMNIGMINTLSAEMQSETIQKIPAGRFGSPANILHAVQFLIKSDYVTGTSIPIDGGLLCT